MAEERLAIVGSTILAGHPIATAIIEAVLDLYQPTVVISGDADGIDLMARAAAERRGIPYIGHRPLHRRWAGEGGFAWRNVKIAHDCTRLVRIYSTLSKTYGSGWTREYTAGLGKPTEGYRIEPAEGYTGRVKHVHRPNIGEPRA